LFTDLIINTPWWFLLLVILIGLVYSGILYFKNKKNKLSKILTTILFVFRFIAVTVLAFLLLSPFIKTKSKQLEKPVIVIGIDNSRSMVLSKDSAAIRNGFMSQVNTIKEQLEEKYDVDTYVFGDQVQLSEEPQFEHEVTNYADFIMKVKEDYAGMNFGALVIAGDGINNRGIDPVFAASTINYPIYTIALGDTTTSKDLKINDVRYNSIIYLEDDFPIEVNVSSKQMNGEKAVLKIYVFGKLQSRRNINISADDFNRSYL